MLGSDRSRGHCLEMICADFLAGANLDGEDPETLLTSVTRYYRFLPKQQKRDICCKPRGKSLVTRIPPKRARLRLSAESYRQLHREVLRRDGWRCQRCGAMEGLEVHHVQFRSRSGDDDEVNLITLCGGCHRQAHRRS